MTTPVPAPDGVAVDDATTTDLVDRLLEHCALVCETGDEGPIADAVAAHHHARGDDVRRIGNSLVVRSATAGPPGAGDRPLVVLAGHLDVVAPTPADREPRRDVVAGVDVVVGRGTSDMKAGNVVATRIFERVADGELGTDVDVVLVLYAAEEGPAEDNELGVVLDEVGWLSRADLVVILEPTDGEIQLGCLGGLHATLVVHGRQAHSARPWHGRNALTAAGRLLTAFDDRGPTPVELDGVTFHDVWSMTQAHTDNGRNVLPGALNLNLNFRFSPSRDLETAEAELRDQIRRLAADLDLEIDVTITDRALPAAPMADRPVTAAFVAAVPAEVAAKQAWTDVARFAALGVPAVNFGPGRTDQAHQRGEFVEVWRLRAAHDALATFLAALDADALGQTG
ncbi:succinyl-diaminopimelate desuccinylase [Salsipaludibacter albus]|uniref:succinyl-diaminopimelate desuccinylase n=1 Tax=Salsipaludibacter albus TaxID=2849650 RepID=UPI001EE3D7D3|nr:succinyl-diaminopimelate desuccinylase [Salsipaludibacter albus]MBY5162349.1 succinyl-diaminopimelate desuccinylase [Salsipaludibacter albus]